MIDVKQSKQKAMTKKTQKHGILVTIRSSLRVILALVVGGLIVGGGFTSVKIAHAQSVQDQINALQQENANNQNIVAQLRDQATSYQDAIAKIQASITGLQLKIDANTAAQATLQKQIDAAEAELAKQKDLLGKNLRAMYVEGDISTLEMLASSNDLSQFIDKQQYRDSVKNKITDTLTKVNDLKHQLKDQKEQVDALLKEQQSQQSQLAASRGEQSNLLSYNQSQQADFNAKTRDNQKRIDDLIASQRRANFTTDGGYYFLRFPGAVRSINPYAYPYANGGFGMSPGGCQDNDGPDQWGYCTRQCVSFAAWAVEASGRSAPRGYGNARDWVAAAYARGIPVYRSPQAGDVAISTSGYWGHAMYVESVSGNTFHSYEYNTNLDGRLRTDLNRSF